MEYEEFPSDGVSRGFPFQQYLALLLRGKWIILASIALFSALAMIYSKRSPRMYEASSMVLINAKGGTANLPFMESTGPLNKITNELGILKSRLLAQAVAEALLKDPFMDEERKEKVPVTKDPTDAKGEKLASLSLVTERVRRSVEFIPERESDIIRIVARSGSAKEAATLADKYAEVYQEHNLDASRTRSRALREFLETQMKSQRGSLTRAEDSLKQYMQNSGIVSIDEDSKRVVEQLSQLEASRNAIDIEIQTNTQALASYENQLPEQERNATRTIGQASDSYIRGLQEQLAKLEVQRDVIIVQNDPNVLTQDIYARQLKEMDDQITALRAKLKTRSDEQIQSLLPGNPTGNQNDPLAYLKQLKQKILETRMQLESLASKRIALDGIIQQYDRKFQRIPRESLELAKFQRSRMSTEKLYLMVEEKFNEAAITEKSEFGYIDIIDRAIVPWAPVSPNPKRDLVFGILIGLGIGIGVVFLRDVLDVRVRTPEDLKRRGMTSLTEIATMNQELKKLHPDERMLREVKRFDRHLWLSFNPMSFLAESYRRLRSNILHAQLDRPLKVIMVTSPNPYEGKSTTIANMAIAFAETQKRVLLIDADIRRPIIHNLFGIMPKPGLTDLLMEKAAVEEVIQKNVVENLDVLCAGTIVRNPARILSSKNMHALIEKMREIYDWVFIDTPPILIVNDAGIVAPVVDGAIVVVSAGITRVATVQRAAEFLKGAGGLMLGVVLNKFDARKAYGGYYGSHRYGHYGSKYGHYAPSNGNGTSKMPRST